MLKLSTVCSTLTNLLEAVRKAWSENQVWNDDVTLSNQMRLNDRKWSCKTLFIFKDLIRSPPHSHNFIRPSLLLRQPPNSLLESVSFVLCPFYTQPLDYSVIGKRHLCQLSAKSVSVVFNLLSEGKASCSGID